MGDHIEHDRVLEGWRRHVVGVGLGILVVAVLIGHARLAHELETIGAREFVLWPLRVSVGLVFLLGVVLVLVVRMAPRLPAMPTTVALVLLYGAAGSLPILPWPLPLLGPWQPRMTAAFQADASYQWQGNMLTLTAGVMTTAAVWGWWRHVRDSQHRHEPDDRTETPGTGR